MVSTSNIDAYLTVDLILNPVHLIHRKRRHALDDWLPFPASTILFLCFSLGPDRVLCMVDLLARGPVRRALLLVRLQCL